MNIISFKKSSAVLFLGLSLFINVQAEDSLHFTMESAVIRANTTNENLESARALQESNLQENSRLISPFLPQIQAGGTFSKNEYALPNPFAPEDLVRGTIQAQQFLFGFGSFNAARQNKRSADLSSNLQFAQTERNIAQQTRLAVANVLFSEANLILQTERVGQREQEFMDARARNNVGAVSMVDVRLAQIQFEAAKSVLVLAESDVDKNKLILSSILATEHANITIDNKLDENIPFNELLAEAENFIEGNNTDIKLLQAQQQVAATRRQFEISRGRPYFSAFAEVNAEGEDFSDTYDGNSVGLQLSWNIYDGGDRQNFMRSLRAQERAALKQEAYTKRLRQESYDRFLLRLHTLQEQRTRLSLIVELADANYEDARAQYRVGRIGISELGEASLNVFEAKFNLNQTYYEFIVLYTEILAFLDR